MSQVIGLTRVKLNGLYDVDVRNARWDVRRPVQQYTTTGGVKESVGIPLVSGSFDRVVPKTKDVDWRSLVDFSVEILDPVTQAVIFQAEGCNWEGISGSTDLAGATTNKAVTWKGTVSNEF